MKVAVLNTHVPFVRGGAEQLADGLGSALRDAGHQVAHVRLPFRWHPDRHIADHMLAARLTQIPDADRVIALKFPAYLVSHPAKVLWLLHQHRQAYDLWGTPWQGIGPGPNGRALRAAIMAADQTMLEGLTTEAFAISENVAERTKRFNGIRPTVLYPPLMDGGYRRADAQDYIFYPSRVNVLKRQALVVEAMRHVTADVRLVIAGQADTPGVRAEMQARLADPAIAGRVQWLDRWVSHEEKVSLFAGCLAGAFTPVDEDYGYVTLESFASGKPVVTCADSGGPLEFVDDGETGYVAEPEPQAIAVAIDALAADRAKAEAMGRAAEALLAERDISWPHVVQRLLSA